jgi:hypothetical protein
MVQKQLNCKEGAKRPTQLTRYDEKEVNWKYK